MTGAGQGADNAVFVATGGSAGTGIGDMHKQHSLSEDRLLPASLSIRKNRLIRGEQVKRKSQYVL